MTTGIVRTLLKEVRRVNQNQDLLNPICWDLYYNAFRDGSGGFEKNKSVLISWFCKINSFNFFDY